MVCFFTAAASHANLTLLAGDILSGDYHPSDAEPLPTLDTTESEETDLHRRTPFEECLIEISHVITWLYKFSIAIRNPTPRDRLEKCADIDVSHFEPFDVPHVAEKFQGIEGKDYLIQRLGKANTRRRQLLRYHEEHHEKIAGHRHTVNEADLFETKTTVHQFESESIDQLSTEFTQTDTTVSTFVQLLAQDDPHFSVETSPVDTEEARSEGGLSQTTFTSSCRGSGGQLRVPDPPQDNPFDGVPFQCPYCFTMVSPANQMSWM